MTGQTFVQNTSMAAGASIQALTGQFQTRIEGITSTAGATLSGLWSGGFVGISEAELEGTLLPAIEKYCTEIQSQINQFNAAAEAAKAFRGEPEQAVSAFVGCVKQLLTNYVRLMVLEKQSAKNAYQQWNEGQQKVAQNVQISAEDIRSAAQGLSLD